MSQKSVKKNYFYSLTARTVALLVPLVVTPHVSRILGADGIGVCSYIASIVSYFVLFANMGIESYAVREIAMHRDDANYVKKFAAEITVMKVFLTAVCLILYYLVFIVVLDLNNRILYLLYSITLLSTAFNFSWFFQGIERFNILAIASIFSKLVYAVLIFTLIHDKEDLSIYVAIFVGTQLLEYLFTIPFLFFNIKGKICGKISPFKHFRGCMVYFLPTIAIEIYTVVDKTMIGLITQSEFENGYYEYAEKLTKMPLTAITAINTIMQARMSYFYAHQDIDAAESLKKKSTNFTFMLAFPMAFGMVGIARTAIPLYLGDSYEKCVTLIYVLACLIPIISISDLLGSIYYTPYGRRKTSAIFLVVGACVNIALNSFLIYFLQSIGAAIASVIAEFVISTLYLIYAKDFISVNEMVRIAYKYLIAACVMGVAVYVLNVILPPTVWYLLLEIAVGVGIYVLMLILLRTNYFIENVRNLISGVFKKKKQ